MALLALALAAALARDEPVIAIDSGSHSCASWSSAKRLGRTQRKADEHWFWGFVTGLDVAGWRSDEEKLLWPSDTPSDYLQKFDVYCSKHPRKKVIDAAEFLFGEFASQAGVTKPPPRLRPFGFADHPDSHSVTSAKAEVPLIE